MVQPRLLISTMKVYQCGAVEAFNFLKNDCNKAWIFTSGKVYIPESWSIKTN